MRFRSGGWTWLRDLRVWLGLAITGLSLWYALRGIDLRVLGRDIARADLVILLLPSIPSYLVMCWLRALRWRHLTDALRPLPLAPLFRGISVGFMANNIFPLRLGEIIRAWYLSRDTGLASGAVFGTVIVERLLDATIVVGMAALVIGWGGAEALGIDARAVLPPLVALALVPSLFVAALRGAPDRTIGAASRLAGRVAGARLAGRLEAGLRQLAAGLGALRGGRHLWWLALYSILIWIVLAVVPFVAALLALGIDLGSPARTVAAAYSLLVWIGAAVALPSAPGFFGPYHAACWLALRPFGVPKEMAVALGTLCHAVFWATTTALGLLVLRLGRGSLEDIEAVAQAGKDPTLDRR